MENLDRWMSIAANVGVLAGIIFLAFEIQVNTDAVRSATYQAYNDSSFSFHDSRMEYAAELVEMGKAGRWENLTLEQQIMWGSFTLKAMTVMESNYLQYRAGAMDEDLFDAKMRGSLATILSADLWLEAWSMASEMLLPEFKEYMDERIKAAQATAPTGARRIGLPLTLPPKMQRTVDEQDSWRRTPSTKSGEEGFGIERE